MSVRYEIGQFHTHLSVKLHACEHGMELKYNIIYNIFYNGAQFILKNARFRSK